MKRHHSEVEMMIKRFGSVYAQKREDDKQIREHLAHKIAQLLFQWSVVAKELLSCRQSLKIN